MLTVSNFKKVRFRLPKVGQLPWLDGGHSQDPVVMPAMALQQPS
ncbi:hypothetical protein EYZ11_006587 [Aspergillus tanneri]|uniref:Uncharacterized protein n=1 Tax=Aspergillus tanneri TaxID=1220188 RepID=A0A4S3JFH1_9EURO|nr:hypothetical protein EYZ11_006587 [Aspergillus tanneri]